MSYSHVMTKSVSYGGRVIQGTVTTTNAAETTLDVNVADSVTDQEHVFTVDVSVVKSIFIMTDGALTIETNNGAAPSETLVLAANRPYAWSIGDQGSLHFAVDITSLFLTNASGASVRLQIAVLYDSTP